MNRELIEMSVRMAGAIFEELALPQDLKSALLRIIGEVQQLAQRHPPEGPAIGDDLATQSQRAILNIAGLAALVMRTGADPAHVRELINGYLLQHAAIEAELVRSLLALPRAGQSAQGNLH